MLLASINYLALFNSVQLQATILIHSLAEQITILAASGYAVALKMSSLRYRLCYCVRRHNHSIFALFIRQTLNSTFGERAEMAINSEKSPISCKFRERAELAVNSKKEPNYLSMLR